VNRFYQTGMIAGTQLTIADAMMVRVKEVHTIPGIFSFWPLTNTMSVCNMLEFLLVAFELINSSIRFLATATCAYPLFLHVSFFEFYFFV
jgi:hypothetical protein